MSLFSALFKVGGMLSPEVSGAMLLRMLSLGCLPDEKVYNNLEMLSCSLLDGRLCFPNPIGLAAGFDKDAIAVPGLFARGFGFIEVGTVTPKRQFGNQKPRVFRLKMQEALFNALGFNNLGMSHMRKQLAKLVRADEGQSSSAGTLYKVGVIGINISANRDTKDLVDDYAKLISYLSPYADYFTMNISSPNTAGLRDMHAADRVVQLTRLCKELSVPVFIKISPDESDYVIKNLVEICINDGVAGLIVSNTTSCVYEGRRGGLSGQPLHDLSLALLKKVYAWSGGKLILIGVGGVKTPQQAYERIKAGASLLQVYTSVAYGGFSIVHDINEGLAGLLRADGYTNVVQAVGADVKG